MRRCSAEGRHLCRGSRSGPSGWCAAPIDLYASRGGPRSARSQLAALQHVRDSQRPVQTLVRPCVAAPPPPPPRLWPVGRGGSARGASDARAGVCSSAAARGVAGTAAAAPENGHRRRYAAGPQAPALQPLRVGRGCRRQRPSAHTHDAQRRSSQVGRSVAGLALRLVSCGAGTHARGRSQAHARRTAGCSRSRPRNSRCRRRAPAHIAPRARQRRHRAAVSARAASGRGYGCVPPREHALWRASQPACARQRLRGAQRKAVTASGQRQRPGQGLFRAPYRASARPNCRAPSCRMASCAITDGRDVAPVFVTNSDRGISRID